MLVAVAVLNFSTSDHDLIWERVQYVYRRSQQMAFAHKDTVHCPPENISTNISGAVHILVLSVRCFRVVVRDIVLYMAPQK
jgi:hypothetical protein